MRMPTSKIMNFYLKSDLSHYIPYENFDLTLIIWLSLWCLQTFLIVRIIQWINTETKKLIRKRDRLYRK